MIEGRLERFLSDDEMEIRRLVERWAKAGRDKAMAGIRADQHSEILMFDVQAPLFSQGLDGYRATWVPFLSWSEKPVILPFMT